MSSDLSKELIIEQVSNGFIVKPWCPDHNTALASAIKVYGSFEAMSDGLNAHFCPDSED